MFSKKRKIDSNGRLVIPTFGTFYLDLKEGSKVEIFIKKGKIHIRKFDEVKFENNPELCDYTGLVRSLDALRRVVIPSEYLEILHMHKDMVVSVLYMPSEDSDIILSI